MSSDRNLYRRARGAMLKQAFLSPQSLSLLLISLFGALLQIPFLGGEAILWLAFGGVAELLYIGATFSDPHAASHAVSKMFERTFNPAEVKNPHARQRLEQAMAYFQNMQKLVAQTSGVRRVQTEATVNGVDDWIEQIFRIAKRIDRFAENDLIKRDLLRVPNDIHVINQRLAHEQNPEIRAELEDTLRQKEIQLENLLQLDTNIKRADIQLDHTLSALGTIYTQLQLMDTKSDQGGRVQRLKTEINHEVLALKDTIDAIDDVQAQQMYGASA